MDEKHINEVITAWLETDGGNVYLLANTLDIKPLMVCARVSGIKPWTWEEAVKIAKLLGCSMNDLAKVR